MDRRRFLLATAAAPAVAVLAPDEFRIAPAPIVDTVVASTDCGDCPMPAGWTGDNPVAPADFMKCLACRRARRRSVYLSAYGLE